MADLDFKIDGSYLANPLVAKIEKQYNNISSLLDNIEQYLQSKNDETEGNTSSLCEEPFEDFTGIYAILDSLKMEEEWFDISQSFHRVAYVLIFSYFESLLSILLLRKMRNDGESEDAILSISRKTKRKFDNVSRHFSLCDSNLVKFEHLKDSVRVIRNLLTHSDVDDISDDELNITQQESDKNIGFEYKDKHIFMTIEYLHLILDESYSILTEMAKQV